MLEVDGAIVTGSTVESKNLGRTTRGQTLRKGDSDSEWNFVADQNRSYTTLFSHQRENKAKWAYLGNEYQLRD